MPANVSSIPKTKKRWAEGLQLTASSSNPSDKSLIIESISLCFFKLSLAFLRKLEDTPNILLTRHAGNKRHKAPSSDSQDDIICTLLQMDDIFG